MTEKYGKNFSYKIIRKKMFEYRKNSKKSGKKLEKNFWICNYRNKFCLKNFFLEKDIHKKKISPK